MNLMILMDLGVSWGGNYRLFCDLFGSFSNTFSEMRSVLTLGGEFCAQWIEKRWIPGVADMAKV